jgi:hypothetical protein
MWTDDFKREKKGGRAKAQRRKEIKDWHVKTAYGRQRAKKKLFAAWRLCVKKKRVGAQRRRDAKK